MVEKIETKMNEIVDYIISKEPKNITYNEYRILESRYVTLKYELDQSKQKERWGQLMSEAFNFPPVPLKTLPPDIENTVN